MSQDTHTHDDRRGKSGGSAQIRRKRRAECQTESNALEKSREARIVRRGGFEWWKPLAILWVRWVTLEQVDLRGRKPDWELERRELDSEKKVRRRRISFSRRREKQEVIAMGRYEPGDPGDFPDLRRGMIADFFHREGKVEESQERLKRERRKGRAVEGRFLRSGKETKSRSEAVEEEREERGNKVEFR